MIEQSRIKRIHFVGIGGAGMSGIAEVLFNMGFTISGSDISENAVVQRLRRLGITIFIGHAAANVAAVEAVVYSSAIAGDNEELREAVQKKLPIMPRAEMLAELMRMKFSIAIAGTHGKTTTTSMIAAILNEAGLDPTFVVGGKLHTLESGAKLGTSRFLVAEADESDGSFLHLLPTVSVITNIGNDHLEHFRRMSNLVRAFGQFANRVPFYGAVVANADCRQVRQALTQVNKKVITYGLRQPADIRAKKVHVSAFSADFDLVVHGREYGQVHLNVGGLHNVSNALGAIGASEEINVDLAVVCRALSAFRLPERRFQVLHASSDYLVVDDYAHHPTEIRATLGMMRRSGRRRIIAVFQPHRYTRLKLLLPAFARSLAQADVVLIYRLYTANQRVIPAVSGEVLAERLRKQGHQECRCFNEYEPLAQYLFSQLQSGDALLFLSAGDLSEKAHAFAERLRRRSS